MTRASVASWLWCVALAFVLLACRPGASQLPEALPDRFTVVVVDLERDQGRAVKQQVLADVREAGSTISTLDVIDLRVPIEIPDLDTAELEALAGPDVPNK